MDVYSEVGVFLFVVKECCVEKVIQRMRPMAMV